MYVTVQIGLHRGIINVLIIESDDPTLFIFAASVLHDAKVTFDYDAEAQADTLTIAGELCRRDKDGVFRANRLDWPSLTAQHDTGEEPLDLIEHFEDATPEYANISGPERPPTVPLTTREGGKPTNASLTPSTGAEQSARANFVEYNRLPDEDDVDIDRIGQPDPDLVRQLIDDDKATLRTIQEDAWKLAQMQQIDTGAPDEFACKIKEHLKTPKPHLREKARQHSQKNKELLARHISDGIESGVIRKAPPEDLDLGITSNHCYPRKGDKTRVSITASLLNEATNALAIPRMSLDAIRQLALIATVFSVIDIRWAFNLIPIHRDSIKYTNFYRPNGIRGRRLGDF